MAYSSPAGPLRAEVEHTKCAAHLFSERARCAQNFPRQGLGWESLGRSHPPTSEVPVPWSKARIMDSPGGGGLEQLQKAPCHHEKWEIRKGCSKRSFSRAKFKKKGGLRREKEGSYAVGLKNCDTLKGER